MLTVTQSALDRLSNKLADREDAAGMALRFTRRKGGWKLRLDHESPGDTAFTHDDRKVLLLDETVTDAMKTMTLDVRETMRGPRLTLRRNTKRGR
jgi:hypothetical protein